MPRAIPQSFRALADVARALQVIGEGQQPTYSVAGLPAQAAVGTLAFATDAVDVGESTPGTGCMVVRKATGWFRVADNTAATA